MGLESLPLFSIIICAQDRHKYLLSAIKSALSQNISREVYEVIVVKNFSDDEIDHFASEHQVLTVLVGSGPLAHKIAAGAEKSKGRYLCFLDDDDLFTPFKLSRIKEYIDRLGEISYYHNSLTAIDESEAEIETNISVQTKSTMIFSGMKEILSGISDMLKFRGDWYASTICVRRDLVADRLETLKKTLASTDKFLFMAGISDGGTCILDSARTTLYRMHMSLTTVISNYADFIEKKRAFYDNSRESILIITALFRNTQISDVCDSFLVHEEVLSAFVGDQTTFKLMDGLPRVLRSCSKYGFKNTVVWYILLLLKKLFGSAMLRVYYAWSNSRLTTLTGTSGL